MSEDTADGLVLPRRHLLEHVELTRDELQADRRAPEEPQCRPTLACTKMHGSPRDLRGAQLEPQLRRLVHRLEQQLVRVDLLVWRLLQREELVRPQVALVVRRPLPGQNRLGEILVSLGCQGPAEHTSPAMSDLFSDAAEQRLPGVAPLALRMRPQSLDEFVGQEHVLGESSALRLAIAGDRVRSTIFYGPPGSGKTTLARIIARATGAAFEELSAVSASVAQVREVLARARERLGAHGGRTILFLDEIHRFNKAQQDALLPAVEEGLITLIGATTENPYFEVNSALLSRSQIYEFRPLSPAEIEALVRRALTDERGIPDAPDISDEALEMLATRA